MSSGHPHARPKKRFGQHFLEPVWAEKVVRAIAAAPNQTFLEIGPGRGVMTRPLATRAGRVIAYEIDRDLAEHLRQEQIPRLQIEEGDFLEVTPDRLRRTLADDVPGQTLRVAGNLPYNVASPILFKLIELFAAGIALTDATVMLQREVADRLLAEPGTKEYGALTVLVRHAATVDRVLQLPAGAFRPPPKVLSTVVRLSFHAPDPPAAHPATMTALTRAIFTRRRKTLANALQAFPPATGLALLPLLNRLGIDPRRRPETLTISELVALSDTFAESRSSEPSALDRPVL